jgi:hypothetical protein
MRAWIIIKPRKIPADFEKLKCGFFIKNAKVKRRKAMNHSLPNIIF